MPEMGWNTEWNKTENTTRSQANNIKIYLKIIRYYNWNNNTKKSQLSILNSENISFDI